MTTIDMRIINMRTIKTVLQLLNSKDNNKTKARKKLALVII